MRRTAAEIAALALIEGYPDVELLGGGDSTWGFYYILRFPHEIHPEFHFQLEERMRQVVREKRAISDLEMVPFSASELFKSLGHKKKAKEILEYDGLVQVVRIGSFIDQAFGDHLSNTSELPAFKVFPVERISETEIKITGLACESKEGLKNFLKLWVSYERERHEIRGDIEGLWERGNGGWVWLSKGLALRDKIVSFFKAGLSPQGAEIKIVGNCNRRATYKKLLDQGKIPCLVEVVAKESDPQEEFGLLESPLSENLEIVTQQENLISSLQLIGKTLNMLGFGYSIRIAGSGRGEKGFKILFGALEELGWEGEVSLGDDPEAQINFLVADGLERKWSAATVVVDRINRILLLQIPVERNLALLLEQRLPLGMCFEKMR